MKKSYPSPLKAVVLYGLFLLLSCQLVAQVGIGNDNPDTSSLLEIGEGNDVQGILIPRVNITDLNTAAPVVSPANSLLVYSTNAANNGFYYWSAGSSAWIPLAGGGATDSWSLTGNVGTSPGTNFIGTTDNTSLQVKTNNSLRFEFTNNGRLRTSDGGDPAQPSYSFNGVNGKNMGMYRAGSGNLGFATGGAERMRINSGGQIEVNKSWQTLDARNAFTVYGIQNTNNDGVAVFGYGYGGSGHGVWGVNENGGRGVTGNSRDNTGVGVFGSNSGFNSTGTGVYGVSFSSGNGVVGSAGSGDAVFAYGTIGATGIKSFVIDDPRDPANKILKHFCMESNEILNVYRGVDTFGSNGSVQVNLPDYYGTINKNASYQLTPIGASMPNLFISKEISEGTFVISGGIPGKKVSWIVMAERNDPYLKQFPEKRDAEVDKGARSGKYLMPELYGQPKEKGYSYHGPTEKPHD